MVHFLGTPACSVPCQQASETERRLALHFYASQGHHVPRPPSNFSELADQVAIQVTTAMGITKDRGTNELDANPNFSSVEEALSFTSSSEPPLPCAVTNNGKGGSTVAPWDIMAAFSSGEPPSYEQATFQRAIHDSLDTSDMRKRSLREIALEDIHEQARSDAIENLDSDDSEVEVSGPWTEEQLHDIEELQETKRLHRREFTSSSFDFTASNRRKPTSPSSAVLDTDTTAAERELRRYFGNLNRIHDEVQRTGMPWDPDDPDNRRSSPTDPITDTGEVENITSQMVSCHMRTSSGLHSQSSSEPLPRPDNLRRPEDLPLRDRGYDYHLLADLFGHDWHLDSADFEHQEKNLGPD